MFFDISIVDISILGHLINALWDFEVSLIAKLSRSLEPTRAVLRKIRRPVESEMREFEKYFRNACRTRVRLLDAVLRFLLRRKGKQIRPLLVLLSAKMQGEVNEKTLVGASLVEMLHTATLLHDDVVDDADVRRGFFTIRRWLGNKVAVLAGDYLLSRGLLLALEHNYCDLLNTLSDAVRRMSESELLQLEKSKKPDYSLDTYHRIIEGKTASLFAACTAIGAQSCRADEDSIREYWQFGFLLGKAFQIRDDILDLRGGASGKSRANDLKQAKITLPFLLAYQDSTPAEQRTYKKLLRTKRKSAKVIDQLVEWIERRSGIDRSAQVLQEYVAQAKQILSGIPPSPARDAMWMLCDFVAYRDY